MKAYLYLALAAVCVVTAAGRAGADEPVALREHFAKDYQYHVSCRVEVTGNLNLPPSQDLKSPKTLAIKGHSSIEYDERVLGMVGEKVTKTIRSYQRLEFQRQVGDKLQQQHLRPEVGRLVLLRHQQLEVPFAPAGPLTWGEIELVRTDVFTPALAGLLPPTTVRTGAAWPAATEALQELTDLERVEQGTLHCRFEGISTINQRRQARVGFRGNVRGLGEDGPVQHQLEGYFFFDLEANHLSYLSLKGTQSLLDKNGQAAGKVEGTFVLTRQLLRTCPELTNAVLGRLVLEPNDDNTLLLYDNREVGVRFLYPRRWRVAGTNGRHLALDVKRCSGMLFTLEPAAKVPTGGQFFEEVKAWLGRNKGTLFRVEQLRRLRTSPQGLERFALEAEVGKQRALLEYYVIRQPLGGGTLAARLLPADLTALQRDVLRIARSIEITRRLD